MFAEVIILTIMGIALLAWVIFCGIQFIRHGRDLAAASVPLYFAGRAGDQRTEELREQQYEDYKERYGL